jgi:hypothetical protein
VSEAGRRRLGSARKLATALAAGVLLTAASGGSGVGASATQAERPASDCGLASAGHRVQHVIDINFDNTHFTRDNPNVPSDLEQMPNLLNFITSNGTLISHEHTPVISHTASDILSSVTGLYGDQMGQPISNAFGFYDTNTSASFRSSFDYWNSRIGGTNDNTFFMTTSAGRNTPAPWVPFTRAGCSFGAVAEANTVLENTQFDIPAVFGASSPENQEQQNAFNIPCGFGSNPPCTADQLKAKAQPQADFVGIAVHCGKNDRSCAGAAGARPDVLPDEPGGYTGFNGLFGAKHTNPFISPNAPVKDLNGNVIADSRGNPGFPGFDAMSASTSLGYLATMQERGVPVTYAYISDAHDSHQGGGAFGPGQAGYVKALKSYDDAFGRFFERLRQDGITKDNTAFLFTSDENDHFVGGAPSPVGCDGVTTPCTYQQIGELNANLSGLLSTVPPYSTGTAVPTLSVHSDSAPTVYIDGNPSQTDAVTRTAERAAQHIQAVNPITHDTDHVAMFLAGTTAMRNLHMLTGDPSRSPTFTLFANPDYFLCATGFGCPETGSNVVENPGFAWNHGDFSPDIVTTWVGLVGPGVRHLGVNDTIWSSHTDDRPTLLALAGLKDDYQHEGRVLVETFDRGAQRAFGDVGAYVRLARVYEQLNSPVGQFGRATVVAATAALESGTPQNDSVFTRTDQRLGQLGTQRDALVAQMTQVLDRPVSRAVSEREREDTQNLVDRGLDLIQQSLLLAGE